ncbi:hypothetical protein ACH5RR_016528 [Cinchona calisaya]|uniref:Nuclear pore complex protein n=1 Tax=Cinchona calisaya TaxID=153742 RepID=A0ABD2ZW90_9GENT
MAATGEGASAALSSSAYEGGGDGAGGKFRKRPFRKTHTTPYDRPPTALRNPSWLSKLLVDPTSKVIAASVQRFFSSVFRKRLPPPPPPPPEPNQDSSAKRPEAVLKVEAREAAIDDNQNLTHSTDGGSISELEQLLKQKTFTRSEIDRLTELLHSRAVDLPVEDGVKRTEASTSKQVANFERQQQFVDSLEEKRTGSERSQGLKSIPGIGAGDLEEEIASPAEIAKAYMGSQVSKVSPSVLGLRSRVAREDAALLSNVPFTPKSTMVSLSKKASAHVEVPENGFMTPRSWGRSAIYNMARTPYSRVHQTAFEKGSGSRNYAYGGPLLPASSLKEPDGELGSYKALKRRSSVLDEDLGSVGPMRRIRQKHNLLSNRLSVPCGTGGVSDAVQPTFGPSTKGGPKVIGENDGRTPRTSYAHVPPKSTEMAARILEHLEKMTPKEKSAEFKLIAAREKTPAKLTSGMLHGQALKSLEDLDSSKLLESNQDGQVWSHSNSLNSHASAPQIEDRKEANGPLKFDSQHDMSTPVENSDITSSAKGVLTSVEASDSVVKFVAQRPQKKRAFMMSALEDSVELDDDKIFNGPSSEALLEGRGNQETSATIENLTSAEKVLLDKTAALPETRTPSEPISGKKSHLEIGNAANVSRQNADITFPTSLASNTNSQLVMLPPSDLGFEKPKQAIEKVAVFQNSSLQSAIEFSGSKPFSWTNQIPEISSSSDGAGTGVTGASLGIPISEKGKDTNSQEAKTNGKLSISDSVVLSSISAGGMSSVVPISSSNGSLSISPSIFSSQPTPASTLFAHQFLSNSISSLTSSSSALSFATTTSISAASSSFPVVSTAVPPSPMMPIFKFGSSIDPSTSASSAAGAETSVMKTKTEKEGNSGSSSNFPFGTSSFASIGSGSSIFSLSSTTTSSTALNQSQGSLSSTGGGSVFNQSSLAGSESTSVTQVLPNLFGSSASSPVFGASGVASFTSSNTLFSPSSTTSKLFGTGTGFGLSTSAPSTETISVGSGSGATSSLFSFGVNAPSSSSGTGFGPSTSAPSAETKSVGSGSEATSSIFSFGINAASSSSGANAISSNGSSAPATYSFGASSSATTSVTSSSSSSATPFFSFGVGSSSVSNVVSSSSGGNSSIFGVSPLSSSTEINPASSSSVTPNIFSTSWQASNSSPLGSTFNSSPSTGFSFGAGSASFASNSATSMVFGSSTGASSGPVFSFSTASATTSSSPSLFNPQPIFGNSTPAFSAPPGNNDQMNSEDSMAEDPVQSSMPAIAGFGQQPVSPSPGGFMFGSTVPSHTAPFQFGGQQNQAAPQNPSHFQASGSLEFSAGGSFSLGSGGDKSGRKIVKVSRNRNRKK